MDNKEINNNNNTENNASNLQDYEIEIKDKKNFFSAILDKFKSNKNQKLLDSGNHTKTTNRSISSLWGIGNIRSSLFNVLDNVRSNILRRNSSRLSQNTLAPEIIGDNIEKSNEKTIESAIGENHISPVIPVAKSSKKNVIKNNQNRIEVTTIDTSAMTEKNIDEKAENLENTNLKNNNLTKTSQEKNSFDER